MEQWKRGAHGNTFGGNPLSCAAAIATLDLVKREYMANAARVGEHFMAQLRELQRELSAASARCAARGLMIGMELIENDAERTPARALCDRLVTRGYHNGLLLLSCGVSTLRFMPPLCVTTAEVDEAVQLLRVEPRRGAGGQAQAEPVVAPRSCPLRSRCWLVASRRRRVRDREPVLKQVDLPHSYYWRELYLPQLTTRAVARELHAGRRELVYSMAGSLWRQRIGSTGRHRTDACARRLRLPAGCGARRAIASCSPATTASAIELWRLDLAERTRAGADAPRAR